MKKEFLIGNIGKLTSREKEILGKLFKGNEDIYLTELIKNIKIGLKEVKDREVHNQLLNRLEDFLKKIMEDVEKSWKQALYELDVATDLIKVLKYSASAFHSQQAAEMGLKAPYIYL